MSESETVSDGHVWVIFIVPQLLYSSVFDEPERAGAHVLSSSSLIMPSRIIGMHFPSVSERVAKMEAESEVMQISVMICLWLSNKGDQEIWIPTVTCWLVEFEEPHGLRLSSVSRLVCEHQQRVWINDSFLLEGSNYTDVVVYLQIDSGCTSRPSRYLISRWLQLWQKRQLTAAWWSQMMLVWKTLNKLDWIYFIERNQVLRGMMTYQRHRQGTVYAKFTAVSPSTGTHSHSFAAALQPPSPTPRLHVGTVFIPALHRPDFVTHSHLSAAHTIIIKYICIFPDDLWWKRSLLLKLSEKPTETWSIN